MMLFPVVRRHPRLALPLFAASIALLIGGIYALMA